MCEHKYVHYDMKQVRENAGWQTHFKRIDFYYCEKCLEEKEKIKEEYSRDIPIWFT